MRLELTGRHLDITPPLRRLVTMKLAKLERVLGDRALSAQVVLAREKHRHCTEMTVHARGERFLHGVGAAASWETSLTEAIDKIAQQALKLKGKLEERKRRGRKGASIATFESAPAPVPGPRVPARMPRILRASRQAIKTMSVSDAAREVDGDGIVVFRDTETASISVLYRRHNGELTLVQTET